MNGVHDMGGMHGMGPIHPEPNEPVFHEQWEGRAFALCRALRAFKRWNLDQDRYALEQLPPADYLRMSYYQRWFTRLEKQAVDYGFLTPEEFATGQPGPAQPHGVPALTAGMYKAFISRGLPPTIDPTISPAFHEGQSVRARIINPTGHTRLPRYARGKLGTIHKDQGVHPLPDAGAEGRDLRQHLYSVRFPFQELWGPQASPKDAVYIDLWESYLEPA
jgi:nitrile hydratase subunit beta